MLSTCGASNGGVNEKEIRREIGIGFVMSVEGDSSNQESIDSPCFGLTNFVKKILKLPRVTFDDFPVCAELGLDISSKKSSVVGSHWKLAACFFPDFGETLNFFLVVW